MVSTQQSPAIFGEVLFDCFPDGSTVLGGAPFNVAWHLHGFGLAPLMISSVGDDEHGREVRNKIQQWGMDASGLQINNSYPTGQVSVTINDNEPAYNIAPDQAYDHIDLSLAKNALDNHSINLLYHGSLVVRTEHTAHVLNSLIQQSNVPTFVDINLRKPWWDKQNIQHALSNASWVKLNQHELAIVTDKNINSDQLLKSAAQTLFDSHNLQLLIITLGADGAILLTHEGFIYGAPVPVNNLVDTVGAGDSFSAVMIAGIIKQWPMDIALNRALEFASAVCEMRGATTMNKALYQTFQNRWKDKI